MRCNIRPSTESDEMMLENFDAVLDNIGVS